MKEISAIVIDKNPTSNEVFKDFLEENSKISKINQFLNLYEGYDYAYNNKPDIVFIDNEYGENEVLDIVSKIYKNDKEVKIIICAKEFNAQYLIKLMRAGVKDTLTKPFIKTEINSLIIKLVNEINYKSSDVNSKIISIFSNKGGIGKTTVAANLAIEIADIVKEPCVVVDFNSQFGDISTFLNVKNDYGISYVLRNKEKINKEFLLSILPKYNDSQLYILSDSFSLNNVHDLSLENVQDIIDALKASFKYIIIDMTNVFDLKTIKIMDNSSEIIFPIVANLPNLRNCQRCLDFFEKMDYGSKVKLILNRKTKNDEITPETIENTLNKKLYASIANNYFVVMAAINRGIGIGNIDSESDVYKDFQNLAYLLTGQKNED